MFEKSILQIDHFLLGLICYVEIALLYRLVGSPSLLGTCVSCIYDRPTLQKTWIQVILYLTCIIPELCNAKHQCEVLLLAVAINLIDMPVDLENRKLMNTP